MIKKYLGFDWTGQVQPWKEFRDFINDKYNLRTPSDTHVEEFDKVATIELEFYNCEYIVSGKQYAEFGKDLLIFKTEEDLIAFKLKFS